ncbi:uncharacterized protein [Antedon mediterranea]|uniref:uncharacterized protein isoform X2 n=1 Tax=Antedon mediterranea TaxID=105859 RepID=UPI003AF467FE
MKKIFKTKSSKKSASTASLDAANTAEINGYELKEKDLPKLHKAAWLGDVNKVKQLAKKAADYNQLDKENRTPLHLACSQGHKDVVEFFMSNKAKLNLCDNHNRSPLMKAVQANSEEVVVLLLKNKADPNLVDKDSNTALHLTSKAGYMGIAALLLDSGALTNASNKDGSSPLHLATEEKHDDVVELLLNRNADVNAVDNQNRTGLMFACLTDQIGMVKLFLEHKANTDIKDHKGWTANDHAIMGGFHGCSHLIDEYHASNRPRSRGTSRPSTGMFSSSVDSDGFGYTYGEPAIDSADDEEDEISGDKMSNGDDSWGASASETEHLPKPVLKKSAIPKLTKFVPDSDTESVNSLGVGGKIASQSRIPRAVSRESSIRSVTSNKNDKQSSKIPRRVSTSPDNVPKSGKKSQKITKDSKQHVPKSGFGYGPTSDQITPMSTPRGSMTSLGDSEWDDEDVLAALEGIPPQKDMRTPIAEEEEDDSVTPTFPSKRTPPSKQNVGKLTDSDKKMRKDVLNKLGMSDVDDDEESDHFSETAPSIKPKGSTKKQKPESVTKATNHATPRSVKDDIFDDDWDSADDDMLPSHASNNKVRGPTIISPKDNVGKQQGSGDGRNGNDDEEEDWDSEDQEEEESEWEIEKRRKDAKKKKDEDDELLRQNKWDQDMREREERMKRDADEEMQRERDEQERQRKEDELLRKKEERKAKQKQQDEEKKRLEQQRVEVELKKERQRMDEEKQMKEERRQQEEREEYEKQQEIIKRDRERVLQEEENAKQRIHELEIAAENKRKEELEKQKQLDKAAKEKRKEEEKRLLEIKSEFEKQQIEEQKKLEKMKKKEQEKLEAMKNAEEEKRIQEEKKLEELKKKLEHDHQLKEKERKDELKQLEIERKKLEEDRKRQEMEWKKQEDERKALAKKMEEEANEKEHQRRTEEERKLKAEKKRQEEQQQLLESEKKKLENEKEEIKRNKEEETRALRVEFEREKRKLEEEKLAMERELQKEKETFMNEVTSGKMTEDKFMEEEKQKFEEERKKLEEQRREMERKQIENMKKEEALRKEADDLQKKEEERIKAEKKKLEEERRQIEKEKLELENLKIAGEGDARSSERNLIRYQRSLEEQLAYEDDGNAVNRAMNVSNNRPTRQPGAVEENKDFDEMLGQLEDEAEMMLRNQTHSSTSPDQRQGIKHSTVNSPGNLEGAAIPYKPENSTYSMDPYSSMIIHPTVVGNSFVPAWKAVLDDNDGLSFTSSEGGDSLDDATEFRPSYLQPSPHLQLNTSGNADTGHDGAFRMHVALRENKRMAEQERSARVNAENRCKALQAENKELHRQKSEVMKSKNDLEQEFVELESKIRDLEFHLGLEVEKRNNSQIILEKTREQLARKEELYSLEIDARQKTELNSRNAMLELRTVQNNLKQLEEECEELRKQLVQERNTRVRHEEFSEGIVKKHEFLQELKEVDEDDEKAEIINRLELADENRKTAISTNDKLKDQLYMLKVEYERQKLKFKDSHGLLASENEELSHKIDQLKNDIHVNEEALAHATFTFNTQLAAVKTENARLHSEIERDQSEKEKLLSELHSINNRLDTTLQELEKSQQARSELERALHRERDETRQIRLRTDQDIIASKDATQANAVRLGSAETRVISLENEIHVTQSSLMERNNQLMTLQRELDQRTNKVHMQESVLQREKEENVRLAARLETTKERLTDAQNEIQGLKKSLETSQSEKQVTDREAFDVTDKLNVTLNTLRADKERAQVLLEEKNENLSATISQLRNEIQQRDQTGSLKDQDVKTLQKNLMDTTSKLSVAEAHLQHAANTHEAFLREKNLIIKQHEQMEEKLVLSGHNQDNLIGKIHRLEEKLGQAETAKIEAKEQLSTAKDAVQRKIEMDDHLREVETKNAKLEVMLKQESARCETLEKNLQEAHKMREGMEAIVNNLNSTNIHMEGRLSDETAARSLFAKEAEEHKDLWETEVKSRSRLGVKMAQLERSRAGVMGQVEDEKRKTRKMAELKRSVESKLENEIQRNRQKDEELNTYKMKLKLAKKKLKDLEMPEMRINSLKSDFERERINMDATVSALRRQLEDVNQQLEQENKLRSEIEMINRQLQRDASSVKIIGKGKEKLEKSKRKLEDELKVLKGALNQDFIEKGELERYKQELDAKARIEINEKLDQVNAYLEEQSQAREKLEQLRNSNEEDMKKELENAITSQKADIVKLRTSYHDVMAQKDTLQTEAARFKELYERELKSKEKVTMDLENTRDRLSNYESKLNFERQRNQHLKEASVSPTSPILKRRTRNDTEIDSITEKVWSELDKSISRHLRSASMEVGPNVGDIRDNLANGFDRSRLSTSHQQNNHYMDTLRRNYFV